MTLSVDLLAGTRPYLYHLTARENIEQIRQGRILRCAERLFALAGQPDLTRVRRRTHRTLTINGDALVIRDQAPLHPGNIALGSAWTFEDFVAVLNGMVFFWPGDLNGPIAYGLRHFSRYEDEDTCIIRVPLLDIAAANIDRELLVCKYNSGSPRCNAGQPSPRSAQTFVPIGQSALRPSQVVEVTFHEWARLPPSSHVASSLNGQWTEL